MQAPEFVLTMIAEGYRLPFNDYPPSCFSRNNKSSLKHAEFVIEAILELVNNGCIVEYSSLPFCVNPLTVVEGKKLRLVLDLRHVNHYLAKPKFKHEDLSSLSQVLEENSCFFYVGFEIGLSPC